MSTRTAIKTSGRHPVLEEEDVDPGGPVGASDDDDHDFTAGAPGTRARTWDWLNPGSHRPRYQRSDPGPEFHDDPLGRHDERPGRKRFDPSAERNRRETFERIRRQDHYASRGVHPPQPFGSSSPGLRYHQYVGRDRPPRVHVSPPRAKSTSSSVSGAKTRLELLLQLADMRNLVLKLTDKVEWLHDRMDHFLAKKPLHAARNASPVRSDQAVGGCSSEGSLERQRHERRFEFYKSRDHSPERGYRSVSEERLRPASRTHHHSRDHLGSDARVRIFEEERRPRQNPRQFFVHAVPQASFAGAKNSSGVTGAHRVLEEVVTMGRPKAKDMVTGLYDDVLAYTGEKLPFDPPIETGGSFGGDGGGGGGSDGGNGGGNGGNGGTTAIRIYAETEVKLIFFRYHKGKVVKCNYQATPFNYSWDNEELNHAVRLHYANSKSWISRWFSKIRFLYFIGVSYYTDANGQAIIKATYVDVLPFEGNRTISRFIYLLRRSALDDQSLTWRLLNLRRDMDGTIAVPYIYVEIVEGLSTPAILSVGFTVVVFSLACGVAYAIPTDAWGDAFTLSGLLVACFALLLAVVAIYQYLGFERLIDDEIAARSGNYRYHPGHFGLDDMAV